MTVNKIRFSTDAESDVNQSYLWYEAQVEGLGDKFLDSLENTLKIIGQDPKIFQFRYKKKVRGALLERFPFLILYIVNKNNVDVISVFNTNQNPEKWKNRLK